MQGNKTQRTVMWGHLFLLALIGTIVTAYLFDARATSLRPNNLLFLQPACIIALVLIALVIPQCFPRQDENSEVKGESFSDFGKIAALAASFGALTLSLETVGFDVATFTFMVVGLYICGERRWWLNLLFSSVFTCLLIYGYGAIIPYPFPLTVL